MINLALLIIPLLGWNFQFWFWLFSALAIFRFKYNKNKKILVIALIGNVFFVAFPYFLVYYKIRHPYPFYDELIFQLLIACWSFFLSIKHKLWKNDVVFAFMEPTLIAITSAYLIRYQLVSFNMITAMYKWFTIYIILQSVLVLLKSFVSFNVTSIVKNKFERFKLFLAYQFRLEASFGLNDLSFAAIHHVIHPTSLDILRKEIDMMSKKIHALAKFDKHEYKSLTKEHKEFLAKNGIVETNIVSLKSKATPTGRHDEKRADTDTGS